MAIAVVDISDSEMDGLISGVSESSFTRGRGYSSLPDSLWPILSPQPPFFIYCNLDGDADEPIKEVVPSPSLF